MTAAKKAPPPDLIDQLLAGYQKPEDLIGEHGLLKQLTKAVVERALQAEMAAHLGHGKHDPVTNVAGNTRTRSAFVQPTFCSALIGLLATNEG